MFQELHSCPATSTASRVADCYSLFEGNDMEQADATMAYTQAKFKGTPTFIRLPRDRWPAHFEGIIDPVCPMELALYGHPESGYYWEEHCDECLRKEGFKPIEEWPGCYWHAKHKCFFIVYVDDFKLAGPTGKDGKNLEYVWELVRKHIDFDTPTPPGTFLGVQHRRFEVDHPEKKGKKIRCMEWGMEDQIMASVDLYTELKGGSRPFKKVATPFRSKATRRGVGAPITDGPWIKCPWCRGCFDEKSFIKGTGDPAKSDAKAKKLLLEDSDIFSADPKWRKLGDTAMRILMKLLYSARHARPDLLKAINSLGAFVHKWDEECEEDLYRLISYCWSHPGRRQYAWVGDPTEDISPHLYADADFAGCHKTSRSTSGVHLCLRGPWTYCPLTGISKKQESVSHSTPEAEIVAAAFAIRKEGLPSSYIWELILPRKGADPVITVFHEDNQTMIRVIETGRNPTMRHLGRTHYVQVRWLKERFKNRDIKLIYERSNRQQADIYTKGFDSAPRWEVASTNIAVVEKNEFNLIKLNKQVNDEDDETTPTSALSEHISDSEQDLPEREGPVPKNGRACTATCETRGDTPTPYKLSLAQKNHLKSELDSYASLLRDSRTLDALLKICFLDTSDAADEAESLDLARRLIISQNKQ